MIAEHDAVAPATLTDPDDGISAVKRVFDGKEAYSGPYADEAPDLLAGFRVPALALVVRVLRCQWCDLSIVPPDALKRYLWLLQQGYCPQPMRHDHRIICGQRHGRLDGLDPPFEQGLAVHELQPEYSVLTVADKSLRPATLKSLNNSQEVLFDPQKISGRSPNDQE